MTAGEETFRRLQGTARSVAAKTGVRAPTQEYLIRHVLESFLDRLSRTDHAESFVLKGGVLLAAYGVRRPTKDVDANAISADITAEHITHVVRDIAAVETKMASSSIPTPSPSTRFAPRVSTPVRESG